VSDVPVTRYARNGEMHIAFQVFGQGERDLLFIDSWTHHVEAVWDFPDFRHLLRRLGSLGRLIHFDRRGTGLSDPVGVEHLPDLETQVGDALAVLDAAESRSAAVIGVNDGSIVATMLAAQHPERCQSLVLFTMTAQHTLAAGLPLDSIDAVVEMIERDAASGDSGVSMLAPSRMGDADFDRHLARLQRLSVRPGVMGHFYRQTMEADVTGLLARIEVPTLVLARTDDMIVPAPQSRAAAGAIVGAKYVEFPGTDHLIFSEGVEPLVGEIEEFLTGVRTGADPDRMLTTLLFTDIVNSTNLAAELGDRRWSDKLDRHDDLARMQLARYGGHEVSTTGDGFFAYFDRPISAVRCAAEMASAVGEIGIEIRAGLHTGEVEVRGSDLGGLAVHVASRVCGVASAGEVWATATVKDLLLGSVIEFVDAGEHDLKGVPGPMRLFSVASI
jgi:class 3 adenylate cyclase